MTFNSFKFDELNSLFEDFLGIKSYSGAEREAAEFLKGYFSKYDLESVIYDGVGILFSLRGESTKTILFLGNIDTVPGKVDLNTKGSFIQGRGAVEPKCGLLAALIGLAILKTLGITPFFTLQVFGAFGKEFSDLQKKGTRRALESGIIKPENIYLCIVLDPTNLNISVGHPCRVRARLHFVGPSSHTANFYEARKWLEIRERVLYDGEAYFTDLADLVDAAGSEIEALRDKYKEEVERIRARRRDDQRFEQETDTGNMCPCSQFLEIDIRVRKIDKWTDIRKEIMKIIEYLFDPRYPYLFDESRSILLPFEVGEVTDFTSGKIGATLNKMLPDLLYLLRTVGVNTKVVTTRNHTDAPYMHAVGVPVIIFGPGNENYAHTGTPDFPHPIFDKCQEKVEKIQVIKAIIAYLLIGLVLRYDPAKTITFLKSWSHLKELFQPNESKIAHFYAEDR